MSEQIKIIRHLEDLYGPRPLLREAARLLAHPSSGKIEPDPEANEGLAAKFRACS